MSTSAVTPPHRYSASRESGNRWNGIESSSFENLCVPLHAAVHMQVLGFRAIRSPELVVVFTIVHGMPLC